MVVYTRCNGPFAQILARAQLRETRMGNGSVCTSIMASVWQAGQRARQSVELDQWNSPRERREELVKKKERKEREREVGHSTSRQRLLRFRNKTATFFSLRLIRRSRLVFMMREPPPPGRPPLELSVKKRIEVEKLARVKRKLFSFDPIRVYPVALRYAEFGFTVLRVRHRYFFSCNRIYGWIHPSTLVLQIFRYTRRHTSLTFLSFALF